MKEVYNIYYRSLHGVFKLLISRCKRYMRTNHDKGRDSLEHAVIRANKPLMKAGCF